MLAILVTFAAVWLAITGAAETAIGRALHHWFVRWPAIRLARMTSGHVALIAMTGAAVAVMAWLGRGDAIGLIGRAAPEFASWATTFEIATLLDAVVAAALALPPILRMASWRSWRHKRHAARPRHGRRSRKQRSIRPAASNDDDDGKAPLLVRSA